MLEADVDECIQYNESPEKPDQKRFLALIEVPKLGGFDQAVTEQTFKMQMYYKGWRGLFNWFRRPLAEIEVDAVKHKSLFQRTKHFIATMGGFFDGSKKKAADKSE